MKKIILIFLCLTILLSIAGCRSKQDNCFYEGVFTCDQWRLVVTAIDEETYKSKNGINVVEDRSFNRTHKYYEVVFSIFDTELNEYYEITFYNLTLVTVAAEPCYYRDENGCGICPERIQGREKYVVEYNGEEYTLLKEEKMASVY